MSNNNFQDLTAIEIEFIKSAVRTVRSINNVAVELHLLPQFPMALGKVVMAEGILLKLEAK